MSEEQLNAELMYSWEPFTVDGAHLTFAQHVEARLQRNRCSHWGPAVYKWEGPVTSGPNAGTIGLLIGETDDLRQRIKQYVSGTQERGNKLWRETFLSKGEVGLHILRLRSFSISDGDRSASVEVVTALSSPNMRLCVDCERAAVTPNLSCGQLYSRAVQPTACRAEGPWCSLTRFARPAVADCQHRFRIMALTLREIESVGDLRSPELRSRANACGKALYTRHFVTVDGESEVAFVALELWSAAQHSLGSGNMRVPVAGQEKLLLQILRGISEANIPFEGLITLPRHLGFEERIKGSHHIFTKDGVEEILNLEPKRAKAKPYQVKQVRPVILKYKLAEKDNEQ